MKELEEETITRFNNNVSIKSGGMDNNVAVIHVPPSSEYNSRAAILVMISTQQGSSYLGIFQPCITNKTTINAYTTISSGITFNADSDTQWTITTTTGNWGVITFIGDPSIIRRMTF